MAHHKAAKKHIRQTKKRTAQNRSMMSQMRTYVKNVGTAIVSGEKDKALQALRVAQSILAKGVKKNLIHKNTVARKISNLSSKIKSIA